MIKLSNFSKSYSSKLVLEIPSLELAEGVYWIKGANGAGKSTLFKSMSGMIAFKGDCSINGFDIKKYPVEYRKQVNYSEAEPLFPAFLTANDLATFVAKTKGGSSEQIEMLVEAFGMQSYFKDAVSTYSSGMLKKTGLLLAFLGHPKVIILDEPYITIDQQSVATLVSLINKYRTEFGATFLISMHMDSEEIHLSYDGSFLISNQTMTAE